MTDPHCRLELDDTKPIERNNDDVLSSNSETIEEHRVQNEIVDILLANGRIYDRNHEDLNLKINDILYNQLRIEKKMTKKMDKLHAAFDRDYELIFYCILGIMLCVFTQFIYFVIGNLSEKDLK